MHLFVDRGLLKEMPKTVDREKASQHSDLCNSVACLAELVYPATRRF